MKNWILIVTIFVFSFGFSSDVKRSGDDFFPNQETVRLFETHSPLITKVGVPGHTPPKTYNSRDVGFTATLIDSSLNGYGPYNSRTNPLAYGTDEGYVAVYRQYMGEYTDGMSAGWIGAAQSEDGIEWFPAQGLNECYPGGQDCSPALPTGSGQPEGRYPSAGFVEDGQPTAIWNEYTSNAGGANGGYPLYTFDSEDVGEWSTWATPYESNNDCSPLPCDPAVDLWVGNARIINGPTGPKFLGNYTSSLNGDIYYLISSSYYVNGYFLMNDPYVSFDNAELDDNDDPIWYAGGYQSSPDWSINDDGVGYMATMGWWAGGIDDLGSPTTQSLFLKKTEDYGETWTSDEGFMNSGWFEWSDDLQISIMDSLLTTWADTSHPLYDEVVHYGDTLYYDPILDGSGDSVGVYYWYATPGWMLAYSFDIATDEDGGCHVVFPFLYNICPDYEGGCGDSDGDGFADTTYIAWGLSGEGFLHLYNPDPTEDPNNWTASHVSDMSDTYSATFFGSPIQHLFSDGDDWWGGMQYFFPQISMGPEGTIWFASSQVSDVDTVTNYPTDIDVFMRKSEDNGVTWLEEHNVTDTPMEVGTGGVTNYYLECGLHIAHKAQEDEVGVFFQVADMNHVTLSPPTGYEDYMQRVYVGVYTNDGEGMVGLVDENLTPTKFTLEQNYPNPFNPITRIQYDVDVAGKVELDLFDIRGAKVRTLMNDDQPAGSHEFVLDGSQLSSGVYFYSMTVNGMTKTRKLVLMK